MAFRGVVWAKVDAGRLKMMRAMINKTDRP
jgi:hypothetical protein